MQPKSERIVELLNEGLTLELTVTNTYFLHARMLDNWGFAKLGKVFYDLSIDEMRDADGFIKRILLFDGHPNVQRLNPISIGESPEEIVRLSLAGEKDAVDRFNAAAAECHGIGDGATGSYFEDSARDEEKHVDYFEAQIDAIERIGAAAYLAQQIDAESGPA